ncbi:MAG: glycosyl hydrolase, partial [Bacteroidota bacterium]
DNHGIWINPINPDIMINCNDGGANVSLNGGKSWSAQHNQPTSEFYRVTVDNQFPYRLYAGQQDNSTISVPSQQLSSLSDTEHWMAIGGGESADVAVDPRDPNIVYANTYSGELTYTNLATGEERQITAYPHYTEGTEMRDLKYRFQWNYPIFLSKYNPDHIYQGSQYVMRSSNKGQSWEIISPDLTRNIEKYQDIPGGPIQHDATGVEVYSSIFALEESPIEEGVIWAGSDDGLIHVTTNGGQDWKNVTPKGIPFEATINKIEVSTHQKGRVIVAAYHYRHNDFKPYILLTNDYGDTWKPLTNGQNGIPNNHFVRAVAEDTKVKGLLYAGTEFGAYVSYNEGGKWEPLQMNLPVTPITDMEAHMNDLVISTQGRSFWILDDLTPLQEKAEAESASAYLYSPMPAYRTSVGGWSGLPASIRFYLSEELGKDHNLSIFILDSKQDTVKTWSGEDLKDLSKGINNIKWNLQYAAPEMAENFVAMVFSAKSARGPRAVPGNYTVGLSNSGEVQTKTLEVKIDPRWTGITTADFQAQFDMAVKVRDLIDESQDNIRNIRSVRTQLNDISDRAIKAGYSSSIKESSDAIIEKLDALEENLFQNKIETSQDEINYPRKWTNNIARLYQVLIGDDNRPTGGMIERWDDLSKAYEEYIAPLNDIMENDLKAFNDLLSQENVSRIIVSGRD